jgi:hypothetical protein
MAIATLKLFLSAGVIAFTSWLAGRRPGLAGFILALPISSLLALAFTQVQFQDSEKSVEFAKSIFAAVPLSLTFFLPFLCASKLRLPFWGLYGAGLLLLAVSYGAHRLIFRA